MSWLGTIHRHCDIFFKPMSDLTFAERQKFEQVLGMGSGYVLNFNDREFKEFVQESSGLDIFSARYHSASGSKAHRLRTFWRKEDNRTVGKLMRDMFDCVDETSSRVEMCRLIISRLLGQSQSNQPIDIPLAEKSRISEVLVA